MSRQTNFDLWRATPRAAQACKPGNQPSVGPTSIALKELLPTHSGIVDGAHSLAGWLVLDASLEAAGRFRDPETALKALAGGSAKPRWPHEKSEIFQCE